MNKFTKTALGTALVFGVVGFAAANDPMQKDAGAEPSFQSYDANGDGFLDQNEVAAHTDLTSNFTTYDSNADGRLEQAEWDAYIAAIETDDSTDYGDTVEDEE